MAFHKMYRIVLLTLTLGAVCGVNSVKIQASLLSSQDASDIIITFNPNPSAVIKSFSQSNLKRNPGISRDVKISSLVTQLQDVAHNAQMGTQEFLKKFQVPHQELWISNQLLIRNANQSLIQQLASEFPNIMEIMEDKIIPLEPLIELQQAPPRPDNKTEWGVLKLRAEEASYMMKTSNLSRTQIRVGILDTGVISTHEALRDSYYGEYGWFDPYQMYTGPVDEYGHGTHVAGTILGAKGIGVFPEAKWLACRGCVSSCSLASLLLCGQFMTCPTLPDMTNPNCSHAPHLVSNSWGGGRGATWFNVVIDAWHAVGIIPVFSAGNSGPNCSSAGSPGDGPKVIAVGSTMEDDSISFFSGRGPSVLDGGQKPDVTAPGHFILSAWNASDSSYATASGTSMASPHVCGIVAMLLSIQPNLTFEEVKMYLEVGVDTISLMGVGQDCGGIADDTFPNFVFGHGRVNAAKAVSELILDEISHDIDTGDGSSTSITETSKGWTFKGNGILILELFIIKQCISMFFN